MATMERQDTSPPPAPQYRVRFRSSRELFEAIPQVRQDMKAPPDDQSSIDYLTQLAEGLTPEEAITFAAYLLPPREGVWWAHQCLSYVPDALTEEDQHMLALAEAWVRDQEEVTRDAALTDAKQAEYETPGVWLALATGWSGGTMGPLDVSPVPPPPYLAPRALNASVLGVLARVDNEHRLETLRGFVGMAIKLVEA